MHRNGPIKMAIAIVIHDFYGKDLRPSCKLCLSPACLKTKSIYECKDTEICLAPCTSILNSIETSLLTLFNLPIGHDSCVGVRQDKKKRELVWSHSISRLLIKIRDWNFINISWPMFNKVVKKICVKAKTFQVILSIYTNIWVLIFLNLACLRSSWQSVSMSNSRIKKSKIGNLDERQYCHGAK